MELHRSNLCVHAVAIERERDRQASSWGRAGPGLSGEANCNGIRTPPGPTPRRVAIGRDGPGTRRDGDDGGPGVETGARPTEETYTISTTEKWNDQSTKSIHNIYTSGHISLSRVWTAARVGEKSIRRGWTKEGAIEGGRRRHRRGQSGRGGEGTSSRRLTGRDRGAGGLPCGGRGGARRPGGEGRR